MRVWLWTIFASLCPGWLIEHLPRVDIEIIDSHFVRLPLGNPQHTYTLVLDLNGNDILFSSFHPEVELHSSSFDIVGTRRTDLFALGEYTLRLPYKFGTLNYDRSIQLSSQQSPVGSLGLGEHSPLWRYWGNFSLTNEKLKLGEQDPFGNAENLPVLSHGRGYITNPDTGTSAPMIVNMSIMNLLLPHPLMDEKPSQLSLRACANPDQCVEETVFPLHSQDILLLTGSSYTALDQSHDGQVHFGRRFFYDVRLFIDWAADVMILSDLSTPTNMFNPVYAFALAFLATCWLCLRLGHRKVEQLDETECLLNQLLELLILEMAFSAWLTNFFIFNWSWALEELLDPLQAGIASAVIHIGLLGALVLALVLFLKEDCYRFEWHALAVFNAVMTASWSAFTQHHHIFADVGFLLFFSTALALVNGVILTNALLFHNKKLALASGFATLLSYVFLCVCNLIPFHTTLVVSQSIGLFIAEYLTIFLLIPTLLVSMHVLRGYASTYRPRKRKPSRSESGNNDKSGIPFDPNQALYYYTETQ